MAHRSPSCKPGLWFAGLLACSLAGPTSGRAAEPAAEARPPSAPAEVIAEIRARNTSLAELQARWQAARHVAPRVGSLPDPVFSVGLSNYPLSTKQTPLTGVQFELKQTFPWFGKLAAAEAQAGAEAVRLQALLRDRQEALVARGWEILWELRFLAEQRARVVEIEATLRQFERVAEAAYTAGTGRQQDMIKPVIARHRLDERLIEIDRQARVLTNEINTLRARPLEAAVQPAPGALDRPLPELDRPRLLALAREHSPLLAASRAAVAGQRQALRVAEKDYIPDITVGLQYRVRWVETMDAVDGADFVGVTLVLNLPVWAGSKQSERVEEVESRIRSASDDERWTAERLDDRIAALLEGIARDREQAELIRTKIITDTETAVSSSLADYRAGNLEFLTVLDNLMDLFQARVDWARRATRIQASLARLEYLLGGPLAGAPASPPEKRQ